MAKRITDIQTQAKDPERVSIFLNGKFWIGLSKNALVDLKLKIGQEITSKEKRELENEASYGKALNYAYRRIDYGMISEQKLEEKLRERNYDQETCTRVIEHCRKVLLLNDDLMAEQLISSSIKAHRGKRWIEEKLRQKGLPEETYRDYLDESWQEVDENEEACQALESFKRGQQLDRKDQQRARNRLVNKGFGFEAANYAVSRRAQSEFDEAEQHDSEEAIELLERRYRNREYDRSKAFAFLLRRHFLIEIINQALSDYESQIKK
jgi:regulatory protein